MEKFDEKQMRENKWCHPHQYTDPFESNNDDDDDNEHGEKEEEEEVIKKRTQIKYDNLTYENGSYIQSDFRCDPNCKSLLVANIFTIWITILFFKMQVAILICMCMYAVPYKLYAC